MASARSERSSKMRPATKCSSSAMPARATGRSDERPHEVVRAWRIFALVDHTFIVGAFSPLCAGYLRSDARAIAVCPSCGEALYEDDPDDPTDPVNFE